MITLRRYSLSSRLKRGTEKSYFLRFITLKCFIRWKRYRVLSIHLSSLNDIIIECQRKYAFRAFYYNCWGPPKPRLPLKERLLKAREAASKTLEELASITIKNGERLAQFAYESSQTLSRSSSEIFQKSGKLVASSLSESSYGKK